MSISSKNIPTNSAVHNEDFTEANYANLLQKCLSNYKFIKYSEIDRSERFILLRHDVDFSLSRSLELAKIEYRHGISSTYFLDIHCKFYNVFERSQFAKINEIIELGHDIGLHFDASFYEIINEADLNKFLKVEKDILSNLLNVSIESFSFHNPVSSTLDCEKEYYAGMRNCYSRKMKKIKYCSDSNGYWRFDRLEDLVDQEVHASLHINLHPGWWQKNVAPPREKIFRTIFGRAEANLLSYDQGLQSFGRLNQIGDYTALFNVRDLLNENFRIFDYLWNTGAYSILMRELLFILNEFKSRLNKNSSNDVVGLSDNASFNVQVSLSDYYRFFGLVDTLKINNQEHVEYINEKILKFNDYTLRDNGDGDAFDETLHKELCIKICEFMSWIENICLRELD